MQPGQTFTPGGPAQTPPENSPQNNSAQGLPAPQQPPAPMPTPSQPSAQQYADDPSRQPYGDDMDDFEGQHGDAIQWSASEFVHHEKSSKWYIVLGFVTAVVAAVIFMLTRDIITTGAIVMVAIAFGLVAARRPRTLQYEINEYGVVIAGKQYPFELFKSFSVIDEDQDSSAITLLPVKRFMPLVNMYYPLDQEDAIVEVLAEYLPYEHRESDAVDNIMRRLRF